MEKMKHWLFWGHLAINLCGHVESFFKDVLVEWGVINVKIIIPKKKDYA